MSEPEMVKIGDKKVRKDLLDLVERCIQCMNLKQPEALKMIWSTERPAGWHSCFFYSGDFKFIYDTDHTLVIRDVSGERKFSVAAINLDTWEFSWDEHVIKNFVEPEIQRVLVLDDLAKVTECDWPGCVLPIDHNGPHQRADGKLWWADRAVNAAYRKRSPDSYCLIPAPAQRRMDRERKERSSEA